MIRSLTAIALCAFPILAWSQQFRGSVYAGPVFSHVVGDHMVGYNKPGFLLGILVAYPLGKKTDVSFSLSMVQKGSRRTYDEWGNPQGGANSWHLMRANYVETPVMIHYKALERLEFFGGLSMGRLISEYRAFFRLSGPTNDKILEKYELAMHLGGSYAWKNNWHIFMRHSNSVFSVVPNDFSSFLTPWRLGRGLLHYVAFIGLEKRF